jgi:beta-ribofuranosylaminobenzene 5'-phosphate synthase
VDARSPNEVLVSAPARLHLGFVDLHGGLGRRFGSLGLAIDGIGVRVRARRARRTTVNGEGAQRVRHALDLMRRHFALNDGIEIEIERSIPAHVGLGSGTQLALATGAAFSDLQGLGLSPRSLGELLERGARSGIGLGTFEHGGFVLDGGRGAATTSPPVISRLPFPEQWRVVLLLDRASTGVHGAAEVAAFRELPPFPEAEAARLARLVLMQVLPALAERDLPAFGAGITELQCKIGDHFAPAQGGRYFSPSVTHGLELLRQLGASAIGQSSWGPTGFAIVDGDDRANALVERVGQALYEHPALALRIVRGCNRGAEREQARSESRVTMNE